MRSKILVSFVSVVATLALLELTVRIFMPQHPEFWDNRTLFRVSPTPPHLMENIPNTHNNFYAGVPVSINSYGLRGPKVQVPKPPNTFRIVGVGDSITFGFGIPFDDTFLQVLQRRVNESVSPRMRYETLNGAVPGTGLDFYYHFIETTAQSLQPDIILIGLCLNDIQVYLEPRATTAAKKDQPEQTEGPVRRTSNFLLEHSELYMASYMELKATLYGFGILDINKIHGYDFFSLEPPSPDQQKAWDSTYQMLSKISALCHERHYPLVIVVFPMEIQLSRSVLQLYRDRFHVRLGPEALSGEPQKRIKEFVTANGDTVIDLLPAFRGAASEGLFLRNKSITFDPVHPSVPGNRIAAEEIYRVLKADHLVQIAQVVRP